MLNGYIQVPSSFANEFYSESVTLCAFEANCLEMEIGVQESVAPRHATHELDVWMRRYQQADPEAPGTLIRALSPALLRFFRSQVASREQADDLLQETWLRIHRVRHTYRLGE